MASEARSRVTNKKQASARARAHDRRLMAQAEREDSEAAESSSRVRLSDEETMDERRARLQREKAALLSSEADDSLRARLLSLLAVNQYAEIEKRGGISHETALFRYAAATTKAVAMALQGTERVCANEPFETTFTTAEAAYVLCGISAIMDEGPRLLEDLRDADGRGVAS